MKNYKIILEVLTPVHIGNGSKIIKKDYRINGAYAEIYDPLKLYSLLGRGYEGFLNSSDNLTGYIKKYNVRADSAIKYTAFCGNTRIKPSDEIDEFIKDPYGCPYIPGSSLKGAIRTAILSSEINQNRDDKFSKYKKEPIRRNNSIKDIEETAFGDFNNSVFKHVKISDSEPLSTDDLILCSKVDIFKDGKSNNRLNLCRESLKPGTKICFNLTIDKEVEDDFSPDKIMVALRSFVSQYRNNYLSSFSSFNSKKYGDDIIYLGGGTGFHTKTINNSLYGKYALKNTADFLGDTFKKHKHYNDVSLGISPRALKCTKINNEVVEMGICKIRIESNEAI